MYVLYPSKYQKLEVFIIFLEAIIQIIYNIYHAKYFGTHRHETNREPLQSVPPHSVPSTIRPPTKRPPTKCPLYKASPPQSVPTTKRPHHKASPLQSVPCYKASPATKRPQNKASPEQSVPSFFFLIFEKKNFPLSLSVSVIASKRNVFFSKSDKISSGKMLRTTTFDTLG